MPGTLRTDQSYQWICFFILIIVTTVLCIL